MSWIRAVDLSLDQDLSRLTAYLRQQGVVHRISEESHRQVIWVQDPALVEPVRQLLDAWLSGKFTVERDGAQGEAGRSTAGGIQGLGITGRWLHVISQAPLTLLLLMLSVAGALLIELDTRLQWVHWLTLQDFVIQGGRISYMTLPYGFDEGQWWRLLTPIFLHFGVFHILFNGLWLWELGRRIEGVCGSRGLLLLVVLSALASNLGQYYWQGASLFGGMSGVIYALLGYIWLRQKFRPNPLLAIPSGLIIFMLVWLVLCMTGAVNWFIDGRIANGAHVGGLLLGMMAGFIDARRPQQ